MKMKRDWYKNHIIYQIYPKSFYDTNHDGIGDLKGIIKKLDYLKELGVNTLWLNPIFVSPQVDNGYDVSNYYAIDQKMGSMDDFDKLVLAAHERGLKIILDFVMNHTSDQHPWFKDAISNENSIYRDYYLWEKGKAGKLPNNWASFFGGSVWEKDPLNENNYYFHLFDKHMPDLNWKNPEVRHSMVEIAKFWLNHGVDGFRLDAFIHMAKGNFKQNVLTGGKEQVKLAEEFYANLPAVQDYLHNFVHELHMFKPDVFILGEAASANVNLAVDYTKPENEECNTVVSFRYFTEDQSNPLPNLPKENQPYPLNLKKFKETMMLWQNSLEKVSFPTLYWSNHDMPRILTKLNVVKEYQSQLAKTLASLMYLQRGIPCIYYGEELGMQSMQMNDIEDFEDPNLSTFYNQALKNGYSKEEALSLLSRAHKMAARGPMIWNNQTYGGFSDVKPWNYGENHSQSVVDQLQNSNSILQHYRNVLQLKQTDLFIDGDFTMENTQDELYVYQRHLGNQKAQVICNLSNTIQYYEGAIDGEINLCGDNVIINHQNVELGPYSSVVLIRK